MLPAQGLNGTGAAGRRTLRSRLMRYRDSLVTIGMAVVLTVLLGVGLGGVVATQRATTQVTQVIAINNALQTVLRQVNQEEAIQQNYYLTPDAKTRALFAAAEKTIHAGLRASNSAADPRDIANRARALTLQASIHTAMHSFFTAVDTGNLSQAVTIDRVTITPLITKSRQLIVTGVSLTTQRLSNTISTLNATEETVRIITIAVFVPGILLLIVLVRLLRAYRRQLDAAVQAEIASLQQHAVTDHLTGLGNHRAFADEEMRALAVAHRTGQDVALALIDVDNFKQINDRHGHAHGDHVLAELGVLLRGGRAGDRAFRLGGDEFALIMQSATEPAAVAVLDRLRQAIELQLFGATISVGIAILDRQTDDMATLREKADSALYEAKRRGRNTIVTFWEIRDNAAVISGAKILAVRRLLAERRLSVVFQPIWRLDRGILLGYEALSRPAEEYGLDGPQEAFDIAERIGRAPELDALFREAILARASELPAEALLFVNLSPQSLDHALLGGDTLVKAVTAAGLTPARIVLEITERSLARPAVVGRETKRLRDLGFRIALDDVGMGNTGLEMLRLVQADYLKIDREVIAGALVGTTARSVLAAILAFAREAGTFVIAEGVETEEMLDFVDEAGHAKPDRHAHAVQGYLTGGPSPTMAGTPTRIMLPGHRQAS